MTEFESSDFRAMRPSSTTGGAAERAAAILDDLTLRAVAEGGRTHAAARGVVCALFLVREVLFGHASSPAQERYVFAILGTTILWSAAAWLIIPKAEVTRRNAAVARAAGTVADAVVFFAILMSLEIWPRPDYHGFLRDPFIHFAGLVVASAGLRFDRAWVLLAFALNLAGLALMVALDRLWWSDRIDYEAGSISFVVVVMVAGLVVGWSCASRARALGLRAARRAIDAARAREKLGAYLGKEIAEEALLADDIVLGGRRQPVAVLFTDLRGFTAMTESLPPEELVAQLNAYLEDMVRVIREEGGVVDKYIGDGIMAVFGAPRGRPDDAYRALRAARRLQAALAAHNAARLARGLTPLAHGVGVHFGGAVAGNVGTREQAQYTLVGDVVNVAARLETLTKDHGAPTLFSREVLDAARMSGAVDDVVAVGAVTLRGRQEALEAFTFAPPHP